MQDRLETRKHDYARNQDYNLPDSGESSVSTSAPRGRGRPKRTIQRPYEDSFSLVLEAPQSVDAELTDLLSDTGDGRSRNNVDDILEVVEDFCDAVTGRHFGSLAGRPGAATNIFVSNIIRKAIDHDQFSRTGNGDEVCRVLTTHHGSQDVVFSSMADEPSLSQAMKGPERNKWIEAMNTEIKECLSRDTLRFVDAVPEGRGRLVTAKWILKRKYKSNMGFDKYKARIVARGFTQTPGVDYNETSSTTARSASWRILMALATLNEWYILQADFISAYLAGDLKETIFMKQFPQLKEYLRQFPDHARKLGYTERSVIRLSKPLYGLKQSGNCWQTKVRGIMEKHGFKHLASDNAIYQNQSRKIIVASYVDDFMFFGPDKRDLQDLVKSLNNEVALTDLGEASWFLGVRIRRSSPTGSVMLDQEQYIMKSISELNLTAKRSMPDTPMTPGCKSDLKRNTGKATAEGLYDYQRLIGKYNFSSCMVRCDTAQATSRMARLMCNPSPQHYQHALQIPKYLSTCPGRGLFYEKNHHHIQEFGDYGIHCAVDASFADYFDTAKSTTEYIIFMAGCPVIWRSKLQTTVSTLTCEAEYAAIFEATTDCAWIRNFLTELGHMPNGPIPILEDNTGAIKWSVDDAMTSGRRHVRIEYHYVVQEIRNKNIEIRQIASKDNPADGMTKPLTTESFRKFIKQLGLRDSHVSSPKY